MTQSGSNDDDNNNDGYGNVLVDSRECRLSSTGRCKPAFGKLFVDQKIKEKQRRKE
jgi:hypothetical protein